MFQVALPAAIERGEFIAALCAAAIVRRKSGARRPCSCRGDH